MLSELKKTHTDLTDEHVREAMQNGQFLYQITVYPQSDLFDSNKTFKEVFASWEHFGPLLSFNPPRKELEQLSAASDEGRKEVSVIMATVLEPDLIAQALEIPEEQIYSIDISQMAESSEGTQPGEPQKENLEPENVTQKEDAEAKKKKSAIEEAVRVKVGLLNNLMNYAGELVLARNQLMQTVSQSVMHSDYSESVVKNIMEKIGQLHEQYCRQAHANDYQIPEEYTAAMETSIKNALNFSVNDLFGLNAITQNIDMVTSVLQENIMKTRMQPVSVVFSKFPRVIRDLARKLDKKISLQQFGQDVELDKSIIELLSDPLTHLIRNSADHGIEKPQERVQNGKPEQGTIMLRAYQEGGKVFIEIADDGEGFDVERIKEKAVEKGLVDEEKVGAMSDKEAQQFIFSPGFSSAKSVSEVSGRGVGMDVVKSNIEKLGGTIELQSEYGKGTTVTLALPLTLAIIPSLIVTAEQRRFAIPQVGLEEVVRIRAHEITRRIERVHNAEVLRLRGALLPLVRLSDVLGLVPTVDHPDTGETIEDSRSRWSDRRGTPQQQNDVEEDTKERRTGASDRRTHVQNAIKIAVLRVENNHFGLVVDDVQDSEEIVVKPLPGYLKSSMCFAGATIMGDGKVAMILDAGGIATMAQLRFDELDKAAEEKKTNAQTEQKAAQANMLLFNIGGAEKFAVDLSQIARIEKRAVEEIKIVGDQEFLKYDDSSLQLFRLERFMPVNAPSRELDEIFVLIPKHTRQRLGIVAAQVEDTVQTTVALNKDSVKGPGVRGSAIINDMMTVIVDMQGVFDTIGVN